MAAVLVLGNALERKTDVYNSLALAALVVLIHNPLELFEAGFQLSFAAVTAIILLYQRLLFLLGKPLLRLQERGQGLKFYLISLFFVSLAAQLGTLPITAIYFNRIPVVSLLANLVVVPLVAIIVMLGYIMTICGAFWDTLAQIYGNANWLFLNILVHVVHWGAKLPFAYIEKATPGLAFISIYYTGLACLAFWGQRRVLARLIILIAVLGNIFIWHVALSPPPGLTATFLDVGQGDAALIQFPNSKNMLVDTGPSEDEFDAAEQIIAPFLIREGIKKIDAMVLTHAHADHIGGAPYILRNFRVGRVVESMSMKDSEIGREIYFLADSLGVPLQQARKGDTLQIHPAAHISILHPSESFVEKAKQEFDQLNNSSIVMRILFGEATFLLTGDAEKESENGMLHYGSQLNAKVLKVGHHGSSSSSTLNFLKAVDPDFAVVSVGKHNRFNLPSSFIIRRLEIHGAQVIQTDENGAAVFRSNGRTLERKR